MSDLPGHIVKSYEAELRRLRDLLVEMGGLVEAQVAAATTAVLEFDLDAATRTVEQDPAVDALEREVEQFVLRLLALRQPVAQDLRAIVAALKVSSDFERIGDYAANVAKRSIVLSQFSLPFKLSGLAHMTRLVQENLKLVVDAVGDGDADKAAQVWRGDEAVDDIYTAIFRELVTYMMEDARSITPCTHLLFIAKNMERIGDHATNIAEIVHFATTGESLPEQRPKGESPNYAVIRHRSS
jgi:phosphate transport system protein